MVASGPLGGISFNFFMKTQYNELVAAQKKHINRLGSKHTISETTLKNTKTILNQYIGKGFLDEQAVDISKKVIKQISPNQAESSAIARFVTRFFAETSVPKHRELKNRYTKYNNVSQSFSDVKIRKAYVKSLDAHKMLLAAHQAELETVTIRDLERVHTAVEKSLGTVNKVLNMTSESTESKLKLPEVFDALEILAVTPQLIGNMIRVNTSRTEYDQLQKSLTLSDQEKTSRCTFEISGQAANLEGIDEFKKLLSSLYSTKDDFIHLTRNMNDLNECFESLCSKDNSLDRMTLNQMSIKLEDASTFAKNIERFNELKNIRDAYSSQKKDFAFETLALGLEKGLEHGSEFVFNIGETTENRLLMAVGTALPVLSVAKKIIVIKQKVKKLDKTLKANKKFNEKLSNAELQKLKEKNVNDGLIDELVHFRNSSNKKRFVNLRYDFLSLTVTSLGLITTVAGITLKALAVIGISGLAVGLSVVSGAGIVLGLLGLGLLVRHYCNKHSRKRTVFNIQLTRNYISLYFQDRKIRRLSGKVDKLVGSEKINIDDFTKKVMHTLELNRLQEQRMQMLFKQRELSGRISESFIKQNKVRNKTFEKMIKKLSSLKESDGGADQLNTISRHFNVDGLIFHESDSSVLFGFKLKELVKKMAV